MSRRFSNIIPVMCILLAVSAGCASPGEGTGNSDPSIPRKELRSLDEAIKSAPAYQEAKNQYFDSLKNELAAAGPAEEKWSRSMSLSRQYRMVNTDSALRYATMALDFAPQDSAAMRIKALLARANALCTSGLFTEAKHAIDSLSALPLPLDVRMELWKSSRMAYSYMLAYVQNRGDYADAFRRRYMTCDDSLLRHLPQDDDFYRFIRSERLISEGLESQAKPILEDMLSRIPDDKNLYGMAAFQLAEVYRRQGNSREYAGYLAKAAASDIRGCVREGIALPTLASWLYEHGDLDDAFSYINFALEDASGGNIRMRTVEIAPMIPLIDKEYRHHALRSRRQMLVFSIVVSVLLVMVVALLAVLVKNNRRMRADELKLKATSKKLESYVGNFIGLCSTYASRLTQMTGIVSRKISSGQGEELLKLIDSGKIAGGDNDEFYRMIDKAILDIFPDFVESVNRLLLPDKRIVVEADQPLTPELRIYAFVRLGVDQSSKIAQILNYSVNTVYAYRNRMRNRAIDRDAFDSQMAVRN